MAVPERWTDVLKPTHGRSNLEQPGCREVVGTALVQQFLCDVEGVEAVELFRVF